MIRCDKTPYTKREAQEMINKRTKGRRQRRNGRPEFLRSYHCAFCNAWHITHKEER